MTVSTDSTKHVCEVITKQVEELYDGLSLYFVIHGTGQLNEILALSEHEIVRHPAGEVGRAIFRKNVRTENSSFLGLAIARQARLMGFSSQDSVLGLFNINVDDYETQADARSHIYHLVWHALDLYDIRQRPEYKKKFREGPMVPKRSPYNLSKANLQADVFAGVLSELQGDKDIIDFLAKRRAGDALIPRSHFKPEEQPFIIAMEATHFAHKELTSDNNARTNPILIAKQISMEVGHAFEETSIRQWWDFSEPAQDMAWRGHSKEEILGAAVNTSADPFVRSTGYLVSEVTGVLPHTAGQLMRTYNAFITQERNESLHREMIDDIFEEVASLGMQEESNRAFLDAANAQNVDLTEGRILGWCANALQAAAKAFEQAMASGSSPLQAARLEFEGSRAGTTWDSIRKLGDEIVGQRKAGYAITLGHIAEICHENPGFAPVLESLKVTMNDPQYLLTLQASNDLSVQTPAPVAPAPNTPAPDLGPKMGPSLGPNTPVLGSDGPSLGGKTSRIIRQRMLQEKQRQPQADNPDGGDETRT